MGSCIRVVTAIMMIYVLASCQTPEKPVVCSVIKGLQVMNGRDGRDGMPGLKGEPGSPGQIGSSGLKGSPGVPGKAGPQGQKGDRGNNGIEGKPGLLGPKGEKGLIGPSGVRGPDGPQGAKGAIGVIGPPGIPGIKGTAGVKGDTGLKGEKGSTGAPGTKGALGSQGAKGATGPPGVSGIQGLSGAKGDKGDADSSLRSKVTNLENKIAVLERSLNSLKKVCHFQSGAISSGNKIYVSNGKDSNYDTALATCQGAQGTLPTPLNSAENSALAQVVNARNRRFFLGINDKKQEGSFTYLNGNQISYKNWGATEPNGGTYENCVEITQQGPWIDRYCDTKNLIVCEFSLI